MIVLLAGYEILLFAERLALPGSVPRIPRTLVFWTVWIASGLSLAVILHVPSIARLFRVALPATPDIASAVAIGVLSVAWRLVPRSTRGGQAGLRT